MTDHEAIETITLCRSTGTFGRYVQIDAATARVELATGFTFIVRSTVIGWSVSFCGLTFESADLLDAARDAVAYRDEIKGRAVATRNYAI